MKRVLAGTGKSMLQDAREAGREAAMGAMAALRGEPPRLVLVFTTPRYDLSALLAGIRSVTGTAPLAGSTSCGQLVQGHHMGFGDGAAVVALTGGPYRFGVASAAHIGDDLDLAGREIARTSRAMAGSSPYAAVLLLADCLLGDLQQLVQGIYRVTGPRAPLVGGAASDEQKFIETFVFHDERVVPEGAVAIWIAGDRPPSVVTQHGWEPIGIPMLVTRAEGTEIFELGGRPAVSAYEEQIGLAPGQLSAEEFWGTSMYHPFGLLQADGSTVIRSARAKTEQGTLRIQGCVPPAGSAIQVMSGTADSLLNITESVVNAALEAHPEAGVLLAFSCAARALIFGGRTPEEARRLQAAAGDVVTFGMYCCGEFSRTVGVLGTHNATLTALAL